MSMKLAKVPQEILGLGVYFETLIVNFVWLLLIIWDIILHFLQKPKMFVLGYNMLFV